MNIKLDKKDIIDMIEEHTDYRFKEIIIKDNSIELIDVEYYTPIEDDEDEPKGSSYEFPVFDKYGNELMENHPDYEYNKMQRGF